MPKNKTSLRFFLLKSGEKFARELGSKNPHRISLTVESFRHRWRNLQPSCAIPHTTRPPRRASPLQCQGGRSVNVPVAIGIPVNRYVPQRPRWRRLGAGRSCPGGRKSVRIPVNAFGLISPAQLSAAKSWRYRHFSRDRTGLSAWCRSNGPSQRGIYRPPKGGRSRDLGR